ncbi:hypothetical protein DICSQDRAFT_168502 [Dichomitus squalens LYAD-421 SS1]|uniref:uncharacterized protein n=1 Tax=Dichomitus squalens (strain LYAD-421) TaxID=732165 RepID=UPI0004415A4F|nr:uncharacterized protein DICSQDRAFT_168502 [Dichomitus squalens LYAD-421 SS1]EJF62827.1 hypothetical protein DICSQDRAFT_168502 [Dichomitus squalens LYAD-421 SS1]
MRCCSASAARVLTLFCIALFSSQSLLLVNAEPSADGLGLPVLDGGGSSTPTSAAPTTTSTSVVPTTSSSSSEVTTASPTSTTSSSTHSLSTSSSVHSKSSSTAPLPATSSTSSSSSSSSSVSSSSSSSSTSVSSSSSSASSTTSASSSSSSSSTSVSSVSHTSTVTFVAAATTHALPTDTSPTSFTWSTSASPTATDAALSGTSASSKGFFDNKGAVAGTFSVVGVVVVGGIIAAIIYAKRRAARLQDEEDMTYFEKYEAPNNSSMASFNDGAHGSEPEMSYAGHGGAREMDVNTEPLATHAAVDAYPDRATHFGLPTMEEYAQPSDMGLSFGNAGVDYPPGMAPNAGVEYPPGMAYNPTQYGGYEGGYGYAATQHQQPYYDPSNLAPVPATHPYANPSNSPRMTAAPPVQQQYYGEAA